MEDPQELAQRNAEIGVINEIAAAVNAEHDFRKIFEVFARQLDRLIAFQATSLLVMGNDGRPSQGWLAERREGGSSIRALVFSPRYYEEHADYVNGASYHVFTHDEPVIRGDWQNPGPFMIWSEQAASGTRSDIIIPLHFRSEVVGLLTLVSEQPNAYTESDLPLLRQMADQLGPAIHNTGLLTSMAQQNRRLEANQAELKNKNAELEESEARLDSIIAIVPDIIYRLDRDGKITFISDAISRYDYHPEEMVGRHYLDLVCEEDEDKATWRMNERRTGDRSTKALEIRLRPSKNNNKTDVGSNRTPVLLISAEGLYTSPQIGEKSWRGTQGVARDITDHKLLEEQLLQAHKMEAVGQLAGGIAHDFDNMLMAILTTCHFIKSDWQGEKALLEDVEIIREAGSKAARLTQQILAFSRQQVFTPELLDLNDVVRQTETMLGRLLAEDVSLTFAAGDDIGKITADRLQIERVIINLAVNASDAMPRGGRLSLQTGEVHLGENDGTHQEEILPGPYVLLRVTDSGEGLDAQTQQQMFEPFFTTKEQGHGTGMGLSMVYGIVKQSGGHVRVDSKKGVGTEFTIYLPRADDSQVAASTPMVDPEQVQEGSARPFCWWKTRISYGGRWFASWRSSAMRYCRPTAPNRP
jgi:PAS domain S-box-containing protein